MRFSSLREDGSLLVDLGTRLAPMAAEEAIASAKLRSRAQNLCAFERARCVGALFLLRVSLPSALAATIGQVMPRYVRWQSISS